MATVMPTWLTGALVMRLDRAVRSGIAAEQPDVTRAGLGQRALQRHRIRTHQGSLGRLWPCEVYGSGSGWPVSPESWRAVCWSRAINASAMSYTPDDIRAQLHQRLAESGQAE